MIYLNDIPVRLFIVNSASDELHETPVEEQDDGTDSSLQSEDEPEE